MSITNLSKFLTDLEFQKAILQKLPPSSDQIKEFFGTDFIELTTKSYELAIMPIILLLDELRFLPFANEQSSFPLENFINDNDITFLSLNKIILGDKATKLLAGLLIQQIFTLAQARAFKKKVIFIIDEVSVVENDSLSAILSEARKYDLSLFLTQQYLTQVSDTLLKSILTNVYNYYIFKVSEQDASLLAKNLEMEFSDEILKDGKAKGFKEEDFKVKMFSQLDPRQCLVRIYAGGKFLPCFKARTMDVISQSVVRDTAISLTPTIKAIPEVEIKSTLPIDPNAIKKEEVKPPIETTKPTPPPLKDPFADLYVNNEVKPTSNPIVQSNSLTNLLGMNNTQSNIKNETSVGSNTNLTQELSTLLQQLSHPDLLRIPDPKRTGDGEI